VIGGAGFVGTNLCRNLSLKKYKFEIVDLKPSKQFPENSKIADIRDIESLRAAISGDVVIHLAAVHRDDIRDKVEYQNTNVQGTMNVIRICEEREIKKVIFTSSVAVYGFAPFDTDESGDINPFNDYGRTKAEAEEKLCQWQLKNHTSLSIIRPTVIFGPGNRGNVFNLLEQIAMGNFVMIGRGDNKKSLAFIDNVVAFIEAAIHREEVFELHNYVDVPNLTMEELVLHAQNRLTGKKTLKIRMPYWLGLSVGYVCDLLAAVLRKKLKISSIRVRKFASNTAFQMKNINHIEFSRPSTLIEGLNKTIDCEFINPRSDQQIFFTE
jgi:nucleoside-diphosphate-sugar epimerase